MKTPSSFSRFHRPLVFGRGFFFVLIGLIGTTVYAINILSEGYRANWNTTTVIDATPIGGDCKSVVTPNDGKDRFIPTKTVAEWNSFKAAAAGDGITLNSCVPINGTCWTWHAKSRVAQPTDAAQRCSAWTFAEVADTVAAYAWGCTWANGWTDASCSATMLKSPIAWTNVPAQTDITWAWTTGWWTPTKYEWSPNGTAWTDKSTSTTHSETGLTCNTAYANRVVRACDDIGACTGNTTLTSATTAACSSYKWTAAGCIPAYFHSCADWVVTDSACSSPWATCYMGWWAPWCWWDPDWSLALSCQ